MITISEMALKTRRVLFDFSWTARDPFIEFKNLTEQSNSVNSENKNLG